MLEFPASGALAGAALPLSHIEHFLVATDGIKIELNFSAAEAEGMKAEVTASDFARD